MPAERLDRPVASDPRRWRPQTIYRGHGRYAPEITDPILEPFWSGTRVMAHYRESVDPDQWGNVEVFDAAGADATGLAPLAFDLLRRCVSAREAVIDGIVTTQATAGGEGTSVTIFAQVSPLRKMLIGGREADVKFAEPKTRHRRGDPSFVALDLLSIDDQPLLDVPLLERKRLLEGAIEQSELVRLSPWVRPPLRTWYSTWRSAGFRGLIMKAANSRYGPGEETSEWAIVDRMPRR